MTDDPKDERVCRRLRRALAERFLIVLACLVVIAGVLGAIMWAAALLG